MNSTSECTTLWGWITASILEYGSRYSHLASMTSNALLTSVAESIVIFGPIRQVGCASASSTVTASSDSGIATPERSPAGGQHQTRHRASGSPTRHCQMAECSLSTGRSRSSGSPPSSSSSARDQVPAGDERLLVGQRHAPPRAQRGEDRRQCGHAGGGHHDEVDAVERGQLGQPALGPAVGRDARGRPASAHHQRASGQAASCSAIGRFAVAGWPAPRT